MKTSLVLAIVLSLGLASASLFAEESTPLSKTIKERSERGTLADRLEKVRGDSGKWRDNARLQVSPAIPNTLKSGGLDSWADGLDLKKVFLAEDRDTWLIFRSAQLDDNDRVWIEKIERKGSDITIVLNHAVWQGYYSKNFTWYGILGVNLGKLPPGKYQAKWIVKPLVFQQFDDPADRRASWPKDERADDGEEPSELMTAFSVSKGK